MFSSTNKYFENKIFKLIDKHSQYTSLIISLNYLKFNNLITQTHDIDWVC